MKYLLIAALAATAAFSTAAAGPFGPDYGFDEVHGPSGGEPEGSPDSFLNQRNQKE